MSILDVGLFTGFSVDNKEMRKVTKQSTIELLLSILTAPLLTLILGRRYFRKSLSEVLRLSLATQTHPISSIPPCVFRNISSEF